MNDFTEFAPLRYDQEAIARQGWGMASSGATDDRLLVGFYKRSVLNKAKSAVEGKPIYEGRDYVKIQHPGEKENVVDRPVQDSDKHRWPRLWANYLQGINQAPDGVPINLLFPAKPEIESTLRGYNIHTVEQLANLSAHGISAVGMGCQEWVNAAAKYMERAEKGVDHHKFETAMAAKDAQIAQLQRQIAEVTALVRQQQAETPATITATMQSSVFDLQSAQIAAMHPSTTDPFTPPPATFHTDLSQQVQQPRRGPGRPRKVQEN